MARSLNKVMIIGNIQPSDPELRHTQTGMPICSFKVVTDESYKDKEGNMVERSEWHSIVFWGKPGEIIAQYMKKGRKIYVEGRLQTRKYEDKEGQTRYTTEIVGTDFVFIDSGQGGGGDVGGGMSGGMSGNTGESQGSYTSAPANTSSVADDDLPF